MDISEVNAMQVVDHRRYKDELVVLDNTSFSDCFFENCILMYAGGPIGIERSGMKNCRWKIQGPAAAVLLGLASLQWDIKPPLSGPLEVSRTLV